MDGSNAQEDPAFVYNFTNDGAARLKVEVTEKLKVLMGDYTDDVLVDYVIVMLRNGRGKDEARKELDVFLGDDDSDSFVSWLYDHLASNTSLYVQHVESHPVPVSKMKSTLGEVAKKDDSHGVDSEFEREKSKRVIERRQHQEPKKPVRDSVEVPLYQHSEIDSTSTGNKIQHRRAELLPCQPLVEKKRNRPDDYQQSKRVALSQEITYAPRRLLQFAVRDAVATTRSSIVSHDPSLKRLRSVVSTPTEDSLATNNHSKRLKSIAKVPHSMFTAARDAAESVHDVKKIRVFDRLGHTNNQPKQCHDYAKSERVEQTNLTCMSHANKGDDDSMMLEYSVSKKNADDVCKTHAKEGDQSGRKIVNISVNVNTWKPPHYQSSLETDGRKAIHEKSDAQVNMANNNLLLPSNVQAGVISDSQKVAQKAQNATPVAISAEHGSEDADSRTIFVSNIHFAATKESLSRHFSKFGDVLKVVIITDAATGFPKGAAYVEFTRKEAAEHALSLDATSFMSRILKVVRRSAVANQEIGPTSTRARGVRGFATGFIRRAHFPRSMASRGARRIMAKPAGARSLQWKRGSGPSEVSNTPRGFTYVRPEAKDATTLVNLSAE